jgi:hypothetical protein
MSKIVTKSFVFFFCGGSQLETERVLLHIESIKRLLNARFAVKKALKAKLCRLFNWEFEAEIALKGENWNKKSFQDKR